MIEASIQTSAQPLVSGEMQHQNGFLFPSAQKCVFLWHSKLANHLTHQIA
jgi:hypothetical protein